MRVATLAKKLLGVSRIHVRGVESESDGITIEVRPSWHVPRCGSCRRRAPGYDRQPARRWRHLAVGGVILWLRYAPRRVECRRCGVHAESVSWAASLETRFTEAFEELVAYLARATDKTAVSTLLGIAWRSVGAIVERVVERHLDSKRLDGLVFIGIDEFSYRKRHHYLTVVVDHIERRVVWAAEAEAPRPWRASSTSSARRERAVSSASRSTWPPAISRPSAIELHTLRWSSIAFTCSGSPPTPSIRCVASKCVASPISSRNAP